MRLAYIIVSFSLLLVLFSCANIVIEDEENINPTMSAAAISVYPEGRSFPAGQKPQITLSALPIGDVDPKCLEIYYTDDGSTPSCTDSTLYTGPFYILNDTDIKAIACCKGKAVSSTIKEHYNFIDFEEQWTNVGPLGFTSTSASSQHILVDKNNELIVGQVKELPDNTIKGGGYKYLINVSKFNKMKKQWENLGTTDFQVAPQIAIGEDNNGILYIAYGDTSASGKATVRRYDPQTKSWNVVGTAGFTSSMADYLSIDFDSNNTPYLAYRNWNGNHAEVMYYDGSEWKLLGGEASSGRAYHENLLIDRQDNKIYLAFYDGDQANRISVVSYNNTTDKWDNVGPAGFSRKSSYRPKLAMDSNNTLYIAYRDTGYASQLRVRKFNQALNTWENLTQKPVAEGAIDYPSLYIAPDNGIYVAYRDDFHNRILTVKKLDTETNTWKDIDTNISDGEVSDISMAMDSKGALYVAYRDATKSNKTSCMKHTTMPKIPSISVKNRTFVNNTNNSIWFDTEEDVDIYYTTDGSDPVIDETLLYQTPFILNGEDDTIEVKAIASTDIFGDVSRQLNTKFIFRDASDWHSLGNFAFTPSDAYFTSIAIDSHDNVYVAFQDNYYNGKLSVMKFDKDTENWRYLGTPGITKNQVNNTAITIYNDTVYVAYSDFGLGHKVSVVSFDGQSWNQVGKQGFSDAYTWDVNIKADSNGTLYVAYQDNAYSNKATVMSFNGTSWNPVGTKGFSDGWVSDLRLAIAPNGTPYVAYRDQANNNYLTVMRYNNSSWESVGQKGFTGAYSGAVAIALNSSGTPYVAFNDAGNGNRTSVMKFDGSDWHYVGMPGFSNSFSSGHALIIINDTPYIVRINASDSSSLEALKFNGNNWELVGTKISEGTAVYPNIVADSTGRPYVVYMDRANADRATVMKLGYY